MPTSSLNKTDFDFVVNQVRLDGDNANAGQSSTPQEPFSRVPLHYPQQYRREEYEEEELLSLHFSQHDTRGDVTLIQPIPWTFHA